MRALLVNPPNSGKNISEEKYGLPPLQKIFLGEPLALETLAGPLRNHEVKIVDLKVKGETLNDYLFNFKPDIVGFTAMTPEANTVINLSKNVKAFNKDIKVVVGGIHASLDPSYFNHNSVDYIISGIGNKLFHELIETNFSYKNKIISNCDFSNDDLLEEYPPNYSLVSHYRENYILPSPKLDMGYVATGFGCGNSCSFCSISSLTKNKYLYQKIENVIRDIKLLGEIQLIRLVDANLFVSIDRARELQKAIKNSTIKKNFIADVCANTIVKNRELMKEWKEIGLKAVIIGFEEINNNRLLSWQKGYSKETVSEAIQILHNIGISIVGDFIVSPDYVEKDFCTLKDFILEKKIGLPVFSILTPLPGTKLYDSMKSQIIIKDLDYYTLTNAVTKTKLPEEEFYKYYFELQQKTQTHSKL